MAEDRVGLKFRKTGRAIKPRHHALSRFAKGWNGETRRSENLCVTPTACAPIP
jgi:hypothetical protein